MNTHGQTIAWTEFCGDINIVKITGRSTHEEALNDALIIAKQRGWTNPKWWQWWRGNDTKIKQAKGAE